MLQDIHMSKVSRRQASNRQHLLRSQPSTRQRQLLAAIRRAVLPIRVSPSDLQVLAVTNRQVAPRQQRKLVGLGHCSKNLHIPAGESRGLNGCFVSAVTIAGSEQGIGLLSTTQLADRLWPLRETLTVNATCLLLSILLFVDFARWRYGLIQIAT